LSFADVRATAAAFSKVGDGQKSQLDILELHGGYALLLIAFSLSFYNLFNGSLQQDDCVMFSNPILSLLTTVITLTREFDASNLSFDTLPYTSHVIFLLFVFLVAIILLKF